MIKRYETVRFGCGRRGNQLSAMSFQLSVWNKYKVLSTKYKEIQQIGAYPNVADNTKYVYLAPAGTGRR